MKDCLNEYCKSKNIRLKYTKNKSAILSIDNQSNTPTIRIHKMFKNCPEAAAEKIIQYYEYYQGIYYLIKFIQNYVEEYYKKTENQKNGCMEYINTFTKDTVQIKYNKPLPPKNMVLNAEYNSAEFPINIPEGNMKNTNKINEPEDVVIHKKGTVKDIKLLDVMLVNNNIIFTFKSQKRSSIHGFVKLPDDSAAKNAIVKLFSKQAASDELLPVATAFTDKNGEFLFKVNPGEYVLKIFYYESELN